MTFCHKPKTPKMSCAGSRTCFFIKSHLQRESQGKQLANFVQITEIDYRIVASVVDFPSINLKNMIFQMRRFGVME